MKDKMIKKLDDLMYFCKNFRVCIKFKEQWVYPHEIDYKSMNDDDLFEFYTITTRACSSPRG